MDGTNLETSWIHVAAVWIGFKSLLSWVDDVCHFRNLVESLSISSEMNDLDVCERECVFGGGDIEERCQKNIIDIHAPLPQCWTCLTRCIKYDEFHRLQS